VEFSRFAVFAL